MNEPKRRGRPPKARLLADASAIGPDTKIEYEVAELKVDGPVVRETVWLNPETHAALQSAQAYASRVWSGQSPDVPRNERLKRVAKALEGQGLSMEGVVL